MQRVEGGGVTDDGFEVQIPMPRVGEDDQGGGQGEEAPGDAGRAGERGASAEFVEKPEDKETGCDRGKPLEVVPGDLALEGGGEELSEVAPHGEELSDGEVEEGARCRNLLALPRHEGYPQREDDAEHMDGKRIQHPRISVPSLKCYQFRGRMWGGISAGAVLPESAHYWKSRTTRRSPVIN